MAVKLFNDLNSQQNGAVSSVTGPSIILAGAGSGKTRVLVYKVVNLVENYKVDPLKIVMITFTNKAANEMHKRILEKLTNRSKLGYVGTFHSFCARILRIEADIIGIDRRFVIYDESDQLALIKSILKKKGVEKFTPSYYLNRISLAKNELISPTAYQQIFSDFSVKYVFKVYDEYQKQLKANKALDFDDLLLKAIELFALKPDVLKKYQEKYKYFLVDEFQDTNLAQYVLISNLTKKYKNITVVGDFSQSIYSWRGANFGNLDKFKKDFPGSKVFHLEKNYRSSQNILDFAYNVIVKNKTHPILHLVTENAEGEELTFFEAENEQEEAIFVTQKLEELRDSYSSFAVLYRTNAQSRVMEEALLHYGVPYALIGGTRFYERREIKDILSYLRLLVNPKDKVAQNRIVKLGKKRWQDFVKFYREQKNEIEKKSTDDLIEQIFNTTEYLERFNINDEEDFARLENIKELKSVAVKFPDLNEFLEQVALVESEYFENEKKPHNPSDVRLMTMHQAKGLEFDCVFIIGVEEGILPHSRSIDDFFQLEEERRLFYVAITRARRKLFVTNAKKRFIFGRRTFALKSRFLLEEESNGWYTV